MFRRTLLSERNYLTQSNLIFNAFTVPATAQRKYLIDRFVRRLIGSGVWHKIDVLHIYAAETSQQSLSNWKTPGTYTGTITGGVTFAANRGHTGNGSTGYISTGFNPTSTPGQYAQNSATIGVRVLNSRTSAAFKCAIGMGFTRLHPYCTSGGTGVGGQINDGGFTVLTSGNAQGLILASRTASNLITYYKDDSSLGTTSTASTALPTGNGSFAIFAEDRGSGTVVDFSDDQIASCVIGSGFSAADVFAFNFAESEYMAAVGAI